MTSEERQEYLALAAQVQARVKGEPIEVEATVVGPDEPTGEKMPLDDEVSEVPECLDARARCVHCGSVMANA